MLTFSLFSAHTHRKIAKYPNEAPFLHPIQTEILTVWLFLPSGYVACHSWLLPDPRRGLNTVVEHPSSSTPLERSGNSVRTLRGTTNPLDNAGRLAEDRNIHNFNMVLSHTCNITEDAIMNLLLKLRYRYHKSLEGQHHICIYTLHCPCLYCTQHSSETLMTYRPFLLKQNMYLCSYSLKHHKQ